MLYGIPNAYNFCIMTLYSCMVHQFYYMDTAHSLYSLKYQQQKLFFFIPVLLKYVKYNNYGIVLSIVDNF
jgi:hypothetical protein